MKALLETQPVGWARQTDGASPLYEKTPIQIP